MSVVKKKRHVSKKNKKAWRKYCDIKDVEDFLEDQRLDERLGKFGTKADSELFVLDTAGDDPPEDKEEKPLSNKQRKRAKLTEIPKCFEILQPSSKVQDPNAKRNHVNPVGFKPTALSKLKDKARFEKGVHQSKLEMARKNRKIAVEKKRKIKQTRQTFGIDLWGNDMPEAKGVPSTLVDEFISPEALVHNVLTEKRLRSRPPMAKTVVTRAAIDTPHPGVSYNPTYKEHQELLQEVVSHEEKMIKREQHLHRVTTKMFSKVTVDQKENLWHEEMNDGLPQPSKPEEDKEDSDPDNEYKAINPPVKNKKKDHKARRKQKELIKEKERRKQEKIDKKKITDIYRLRKLQVSIIKKDQKSVEERAKRATKRAEKEATATPALNAHKMPVKEPDFVDPSLLSGDLRQIEPKSNLLRERYESLQRRGALAGSKLMMKKRRKTKGYFKPGHKVTEQDIQRYVTRSSGKK